MECNFINKNLAMILTILLATITLFYYREELTNNSLLFYTDKYSSTDSNWSSWLPRDELGIALARASTADKTVIVAVINEAYVESDYPSMFDLFLEGFWVGERTRPLLRHLVVVSMDKAAHERCLFRRLNCYLLVAGGGGFSSEKLYMSGEFIEMMWRRTAFLLEVLHRGYNC
ncbi:uncharacterized protein At1g28695-like [Salvia splendens]|uniref:uncharacterized protein At1g28695-like n=1 Tax=Salvia splendens TaxID=180675 RepID=UPI001C27B0A5|nr:uncharacterized protein At1g28695-like [Salvia splendens]